ncbi:orotidine-5'-phosphate decarboxylase [Marinilactibacillus piezotolerans]|uniref:orotidine-5'-phosphate decarboxylase n=1 Tax=Marinilactibacillus piezotolerans TaxID=258723 RepID=UPI0009B01F07|nr:orotidine-5'-phosphate decarboxylase [Marinilactibacillus piezotolerans]
MDNKPIIALDFSTKQEVRKFLEQFPSESLNLKIGMELFYQQGPEMLYELKTQGHDLFLDIKLHDIPTTVRKAMKGLASLGVDMVNLHAAGGRKMMEAAKEGLTAGTPAGQNSPILLAVTQLTSTTEQMIQEEQRLACSLEESVLHYAELAKASGADGVVCSVLEAEKIKKTIAPTFYRVTPGIRLAKDDTNDQHRVADPKTARISGASHIVVGRTITQSTVPFKTYQTVLKEWKGE